MQRLSFAAAAVIGLLAAISPAFAEGGKMPRIISLSGHGEVRAWSLGLYPVLDLNLIQSGLDRVLQVYRIAPPRSAGHGLGA